MSYPEHDKLQKVRDNSQEIGCFLEWLNSTKQIHLAKWVDVEYTDEDRFGRPKKIIRNELCVQPTDINAILAEYFNIDLKKLEEEKRAMLDEIRKLNSQTNGKKPIGEETE